MVARLRGNDIGVVTVVLVDEAGNKRELPTEILDLEGERGGGGGWGSSEIEMDLEEVEGEGGRWEQTREKGFGFWKRSWRFREETEEEGKQPRVWKF